MPADSRSKNGVALLRLCRGHPRLYVATKQIRREETKSWMAGTSSAVTCRLFSRYPRMPEPRVERVEGRLGGLRDHGAGGEDRFGAGGLERFVILRRHDAADHEHNVGAAVFFQLG